MYWVTQTGITWTLARTWAAGRQRERQLKQAWSHSLLPDLQPAEAARTVAAMTEQLRIGSRVLCGCPRFLAAAPIQEHIRHRPDGRIYFPPAAPHVDLQVWHRPDCSAGRA
jgi:hypothetical protein